MTFIWFCLTSYGLTQILVYGKIFEPIRPKQGWFGQLLNCPMCTGFWTGLFLWSVSSYTQLFTFDDSFVTAFLLGCASSAASFLGSMFVGDEGININHTVYVEKD